MSYEIASDEKSLISRCINQDREAQFILYNKYKDAMYTILVRMLGNKDDAADALQDAFVKVFSNIKSFKQKSSLGAWIKTIVVRQGITAQGKINIHESLELAAYKIVELDQHLLGEALDHAISKLAFGYRNVFILYAIEGYSHKEVADLLNISEGTSKSYLFHAKKLLQQYLVNLKPK